MNRPSLLISWIISVSAFTSEINPNRLHSTPCQPGLILGEISKLDWPGKRSGKELFLIQCGDAGNAGLDWMNIAEFEGSETINLLLEARVRKARIIFSSNSMYPAVVDSACAKSGIDERTGEPTFSCTERIFSYKDGKYQGGLNGGSYGFILDSAYLAYYWRSIRRPSDLSIAHQTALQAFKSGKYQTAALISYQAVTSRRAPYDSISLATLNDFGYFLGETCEFKAAEKVLKEILTVQPFRTSATLNLADVYRYEGKEDSAKIIFHTVSEFL